MVEARCAMLRSRCWMGVSRSGGEGERRLRPGYVVSERMTTERRREAGTEVVDEAGVGVIGAGTGVIVEAAMGVVDGTGLGVVEDGGRVRRLGCTSSTSNVVLAGWD